MTTMGNGSWKVVEADTVLVHFDDVDYFMKFELETLESVLVDPLQD